jgi:hypothetical protein
VAQSLTLGYREETPTEIFLFKKINIKFHEYPKNNPHRRTHKGVGHGFAQKRVNEFTGTESLLKQAKKLKRRHSSLLQQALYSIFRLKSEDQANWDV